MNLSVADCAEPLYNIDWSDFNRKTPLDFKMGSIPVMYMYILYCFKFFVQFC